MAGKGQYERLTEDEIKTRDAALKAAGKMPKNPKRKAAAYRELLAQQGKPMNPLNAAPKKRGPKPKEKTLKPTVMPKAEKLVKKATAKKLKPVKKVLGKKLREFDPTACVPGMHEITPEMRWQCELGEKLSNARFELHFLCESLGNLGELATHDQCAKFQELIDKGLDRYTAAAKEYYAAPNPDVVPELLETEDLEPEVDEEPEAETPSIPLPPAQPVLPTPPAPPPLPSSFFPKLVSE